MSFLAIWGSGFLVSMFFLTLLWIYSVYLKNASIIDPFWGLGFVILTYYYLFETQRNDWVSWLIVGLITLWGLRLSFYLFIRNKGKEEDYRYQEFRRTYGAKRYWWVSFFQVFLLQGSLMSLVALPILGVLMPAKAEAIPGLVWPALVLWLIGFIFEAGGDYQLARFKRTRKNGQLLSSGLWRYTRHPNYFGDALMWWAIGLLSVSNGYYWPLIGPLIMNLLLLKVSGVSMLERTLKETKPGYADYIASTPAFFPWFPKSLKS